MDLQEEGKMNLEKEIIIIRKVSDIDKVLSILPVNNKDEVKSYLEQYVEMYEQFAFALDTGMIVAAKIEGNLSISPPIIKMHYEIDKYQISYEGENYRVCVYDDKTGEILALQKNDTLDIEVTGKILYDSLMKE